MPSTFSRIHLPRETGEVRVALAAHADGTLVEHGGCRTFDQFLSHKLMRLGCDSLQQLFAIDRSGGENEERGAHGGLSWAGSGA